MDWKKPFREHELNWRECIVWDPWVVLSVIALLILEIAHYFVLNQETFAANVVFTLMMLCIVLGVVRFVWLWCNREDYDFSASHAFYRRFHRWMLFLELIGIIATIFVLIYLWGNR